MAARLLERIRDDDEFDLISDEIDLALAHYDSQLSAMILVTILAKTIDSIADEADRSMMINYASDMILAVAGMEMNQPKEGPHEKISNRSGAARSGGQRAVRDTVRGAHVTAHQRGLGG